MWVFHWSLNDSKSPSFSRTLYSILADLNNAVIWMVLARPSISNHTSPLTKPLGIVLIEPITIGITIIFSFHSFFSSLTKLKYLSFFLFSLIFFLWFTIRQVLFSFLLIITRFDLLAGIRWSVCISKSQRILCISSFRMHCGLHMNHLVV